MLALLLMGLLISALDVKEVLAQSPVPVISGPALSNQATIDVTIDFGDSGRAILASEIGNPAKVEIVGGTAGGKVSQNSPQDTVWLMTITRSGGNSDVNVTVHSGWYQDEAGNWNLDASKVFIYDGFAPDIGITNLNISKTVVGQGRTMSIKVTIFNYGNSTEHFNLTIYASTTVIHTSENIPLTSRNSTTITFTWNNTGFEKGNYLISATATPLPGEIDTENNTFLSPTAVTITILGDVNGDKTVNVLDLISIANHLGHLSGNGHTPYSLDWYICMNTDLNNDGAHNVLDLILCANHLGQHWP
jgi:hypothetical protein